MSLSCECGDYESEPGDVGWYYPLDFSTYTAKRSTKCVSCGDKIKPGDDCGRFERYKIPEWDVEAAIYDEDGEVPRAAHHHCYRCAGLFFSLNELGYCMSLTDDMRELVKEYAEMKSMERAT